MTTVHPLCWPEGWRRTPLHQVEEGKNRFRRVRSSSGQSPFWTLAEARDALLEELHRLGATPWTIVISSNFKVTARGVMTDSGARPMDQGVAVYFELGERSLVMACDRFRRAEENMRSITLAIEAMRALERHGGGVMMERAFTGFLALPAAGPDCWTVLGIPPGARPDEIEKAYRVKAKTRHPDQGGSLAAMTELNVARDEALKLATAA